MLATICVGCFFKETVLVCALLVLFATRWKWWSRLVSFAGMIAVYALGKKLLLAHLNFHVASFSMSNGTNLAGLLRHTVLIANLKMIFSFSMPHPIFTNAGTLAAVLLLGWRRRFLPYMTVILVSFAGLMVYGAFTETRDFMQLLPLSLILLSEFWPDYIRPDTAAHTPAISTPALAMRATFPVLIPITIAVIGLSTGIAARQYYKISENLSPGRPAPSETGKHVIEPKGHFNNLTVENQFLREEYAGAELELVSVCLNNQQLPDAIEHSRRLLELDTNSIPALNNLAWLLATTSDPQLRNGKEAVHLAEQACQLTQYKEAYPVGTLAAAYAEAGRFDDAVAAAKKFRTVALAHGQDEIVAKNEQLLKLLESGRAYHQEPQLIASDSELLRAAYAGDELELARASLGNQHTSDAIKHYQRLLELDTNSIPALNDLALLRATASDPHLRNGKEAVHLAEQACQLTQFNVPFLVGTLAAAYAEAGRFKEAVSTAEKARTLALAQGQKEIAAKNEQLLELYKTGRAYHQEAKPAP